MHAREVLLFNRSAGQLWRCGAVRLCQAIEALERASDVSEAEDRPLWTAQTAACNFGSVTERSVQHQRNFDDIARLKLKLLVRAQSLRSIRAASDNRYRGLVGKSPGEL